MEKYVLALASAPGKTLEGTLQFVEQLVAGAERSFAFLGDTTERYITGPLFEHIPDVIDWAGRNLNEGGQLRYIAWLLVITGFVLAFVIRSWRYNFYAVPGLIMMLLGRKAQEEHDYLALYRSLHPISLYPSADDRGLLYPTVEMRYLVLPAVVLAMLGFALYQTRHFKYRYFVCAVLGVSMVATGAFVLYQVCILQGFYYGSPVLSAINTVVWVLIGVMALPILLCMSYIAVCERREDKRFYSPTGCDYPTSVVLRP